MWMRPMVAAVLGLAAGYVLRGNALPEPSTRELPSGSHPAESSPAASSGTQERAEATSERRDQRSSRAEAPAASAPVDSARRAQSAADSSAQLQALRVSRDDAQRQLSADEAEIERLETSLGLRRTRHEFDLTSEDWAELQRQGTLKFRMPCGEESEAVPSDEVLGQLGLAPSDRDAIANAYAQSRERRWTVLGPLCASALGTTVEVAHRVGLDSCESIAMNHAYAHEQPLASFRRIAGYRAGRSPLPAPAAQTPFDQLVLYFTGELAAFEADLASAFGPEQAHELVFSKGLCLSNSTYQLGGRADGREDTPQGLKG